MIRRIMKKYDSLMLVFVVSYVAIFILSLIAGVLIMQLSYKKFENDTYNYNTAVVDLLISAIEPIARDTERYAQSIQSNTGIIDLIQKEDVTINDYDEFMPLIRELNNYRVRRDYINDIYIYCNASDLIVGEAIYDPGSVYGDKFLNCAEDFSEWENEYLKENHYIEFMPAGEINEIDLSGRLNLVNTIYKNRTDESIGTMIISLNIDNIIKNIFMEGLTSESSFYVLDKTKNPLIAYNFQQQDVDAIPYIDLNNGGQIQTRGDRFITFSHVGGSGWIYAVVSPKSVVLQNVSLMRFYFTIIITLYAVSGLLIGVYSLRRNYRSVVSIVEKLGFRHGVVKVGVSDIIEKIDMNNAHRIELEYIVNKYDNEKRNNSIMDVIREGVNGDEAHGNSFPERYFCIMAVRINDGGIFDVRTNENKSMAAMCIMNVLDELLNDVCVHYIAIEKSGTVYCIMNYSCGSGEFVSKLEGVFQKTADFLDDHFDMIIEGGLSSIKEESAEGLYSEALSVLDYRSVSAKSELHYFDDKEDRDLNEMYYYPREYEENILNCIESGDEKGLSDILNEIMEKNIINPKLDIQLKFCFYYDLLSTYKKATERQHLNLRQVSRRLMNVRKSYSSIKACATELCDAMKEQCRLSKDIKEKAIDETVIAIEHYIDENFADVNLNLNTISDHFGISRQTISKKLNAALGEKVGDLILKVRINEGKKLLKKTNLNISDVAMLVGYTDSNSFIRAFKKLCGITPGNYRKNILDKGDD